jgi:hypothetical protein
MVSVWVSDESRLEMLLRIISFSSASDGGFLAVSYLIRLHGLLSSSYYRLRLSPAQILLAIFLISFEYFWAIDHLFLEFDVKICTPRAVLTNRLTGSITQHTRSILARGEKV